MSKRLTDKLFMLGRYIGHVLHAKSRYSVHSPYVYNLVEKVIRPGSPPAVCGPVEALRERMLRERRTIMKTDLGSGGGKEGAVSYLVKISRLARFSAVPARRAARLFNLVRHLDATHVLELGTSLGISAAYMAKANPEARIITLEGCPELAMQARRNMEEMRLKNVEVITGHFREKLPEALSTLQRLDLVFIDGDHREGPAVDYFHQCLPFTHPGTVIILDDIHCSKGMERAWEKIAAHTDVTVSIDLFYQGWILLKKELSPQRFVLRYP